MEQTVSPRQYYWLKKINNVLFVGTLLLGMYIVAGPFAPDVFFALHPLQKSIKEFLGIEQVQNVVIDRTKEGPAEPIPEQNTLVISKIDVNGLVYDGAGVGTLEKGIWHRPKSSTPDKGSNTVLVAHRFLYTSGPNTFYHLDKVKVNDEFILYWNQKKYSYKVFETKVVPPTAFYIEAPTSDSIVTLWTCTPVFTATNRLVVRAKLIES